MLSFTWNVRNRFVALTGNVVGCTTIWLFLVSLWHFSDEFVVFPFIKVTFFIRLSMILFCFVTVAFRFSFSFLRFSISFLKVSGLLLWTLVNSFSVNSLKSYYSAVDILKQSSLLVLVLLISFCSYKSLLNCSNT